VTDGSDESSGVNPNSGPRAAITVASLNLLNDLTYWSQRGPLVVAELQRLQPDLVALQEVSLPFNNAEWLAERLQGYTVHLSRKLGGRALIEGLAILSRLPVHDHQALPLIHQERVAQRVTVEHYGSRFIFANAHTSVGALEIARTWQAKRLMAWLPEDTPCILCGDFNTLPSFPSIRMLKKRFASAYVRANGREPAYTIPTPLPSSPTLRSAMRDALVKAGGLMMGKSGGGWQGTVDYIFVDQRIQVVSSVLAFDQPLASDARMYPSDHLGLTARLQLPVAE
jgi:endonuclease/exonuclease/phosphatase family metal-dependent hydrolase